MDRRTAVVTASVFLAANGPSCAWTESGPAAAGAPVRAIRVEEQSVAAGDRSDARVNRPYFDAEGRLRWADAPVDSPAVCPPGAQAQRRTLMLTPRVDRVRCVVEGRAKASTSLVGIDEDGKVAWSRALGFPSGRFTIDEEVIGASPDGVVLSNLTVIAPATGRTILPGPTHEVGAERRPVPDHDLTGAALYLPDRRGFLWFSADVTLLSRKGGLFAIDAATGRKELVLPVSATLTGGYWRVEEMARAPEGPYVLLAEQFAVRGPGGVALEVFDPERREVVFRERFGEGGFCEDPRVVTGPGDSSGFSYLDATAGKRVLVRYRLGRP